MILTNSFWLGKYRHDAEDCKQILHGHLVTSVAACCVEMVACSSCRFSPLQHARPSLKCLYGPGRLRLNDRWIRDVVLSYPDREEPPEL